MELTKKIIINKIESLKFVQGIKTNDDIDSLSEFLSDLHRHLKDLVHFDYNQNLIDDVVSEYFNINIQIIG